jgi:hypothetical protein
LNEARAEQIELGAVVHLAREELELGDLAFGLAIAPGCCRGGTDGGLIKPVALGQSLTGRGTSQVGRCRPNRLSGLIAAFRISKTRLSTRKPPPPPSRSTDARGADPRRAPAPIHSEAAFALCWSVMWSTNLADKALHFIPLHAHVDRK